MSGLIPPEFVDDLIGRIDIVDIIGGRLPLTRAGKDYKARCPFHDEKTPSFTVAPDKQFYHCFGCGAHGTAIGFLMEYDRLSFHEAIEELAQQAGLSMPEAAGAAPSGPDPRPLYETLQQAADLFRRQLRQHPERGRAIDYLKQRGLSGEIATRFGLGFAPSGWETLLRSLGGGPDAVDRLCAAGLVIARDDKRYDRFRDRIMFPIRDRRGRVIGFGGRVLGDGEPKYLNSPETAVFHKGRELYGLFEAQQSQRRLTRLLVVEGYMDVIALAQHGVPYAVATLGTATTPEHVKQLMRSAPELMFCFDGDRAGRDAAWKALKTALPQAGGQQPIRFLFLPDGEDPDSLIRKEGRTGFEQYLAQAVLLSDFLFEHLTTGLDLTTAEGCSALDAAARPLLQTVPTGTFRALLEERLAQLIGLRRPQRVVTRDSRSRSSARPSAGRLTTLRKAIALLLDQPGLAATVADRPLDWAELDNPGVSLLKQIIDIVEAYPTITAAALCERWRGTDQEPIVDQLSDSRLIAHIPDDGRVSELIGAIEALNHLAVRERRWRLLSAASIGDLSPEQRARLRGETKTPPELS